ncbi:MAG: GFA family protein [Ancalomicrobiaceae bacterium]|nr:GFA family protein [Ancalomicrobiaceae bacterium]
MTSADHRITGGCQCGAVRFACEELGRASICHCRMCQKAFGGFFGPLVTAKGVVWTRGEPARFRSSNRVRRGFCATCGTPLTFEVDGATDIDIAIGAFDHPEAIAPVIQVGTQGRLPFIAELAGLPELEPEERQKFASYYDSIVSYQHPDHD